MEKRNEKKREKKHGGGRVKVLQGNKNSFECLLFKTVGPCWLSIFKDIYLAALGHGCHVWDLLMVPRWNLSPLHWEHEVLASGPPGKS